MLNPTPDVNCKYGAPMGRETCGNGASAENSKPFNLVRIRLDSGGYDSGGAYWGLGAPLCYFEGPTPEISGYVRGISREKAKEAVRSIHKHVRFYR